MTAQLHFGAVIKIPANTVNLTGLNSQEAQQFAQQWQMRYAASRPAPPPPPNGPEGKDGNKPPKPPGPLEQFAFREDNGDLYVANGEHALLLNSMPAAPLDKKIKFDVIA